MSQQNLPIEVELAQAYLDGFDKDPLIGLKSINNYHEPNFIDHRTGKFYLVRCYECPDDGRSKHCSIAEHGRENYGPNVSSGKCTWCGWKPNPQILGYIKAVKIISDTHPLLDDSKCQAGQDFGMTLEDIKRRYPDQYEEAIKQVRGYEPEDTEDDGHTD